jgi:hypothetical protein
LARADQAWLYQQPYGWPGEKTTTDMPGMVNIRQIRSSDRHQFAASR